MALNLRDSHSRWENTWTTLRVWLTTWDIKHIISFKDIMLARYMERVYEEEYSALNRERSIAEELIILTGRFNSIQKEKRLGKMAWESAEPETNKIRASLLELLNKLESIKT